MKHGKDFMIILPFVGSSSYLKRSRKKWDSIYLNPPSHECTRSRQQKSDIIIIKNEILDVWNFKCISIKISNNINRRNNYSSLSPNTRNRAGEWGEIRTNTESHFMNYEKSHLGLCLSCGIKRRRRRLSQSLLSSTNFSLMNMFLKSRCKHAWAPWYQFNFQVFTAKNFSLFGFNSFNNFVQEMFALHMFLQLN